MGFRSEGIIMLQPRYSPKRQGIVGTAVFRLEKL